MTVQELIIELNKIPNRNLDVYARVECYDTKDNVEYVDYFLVKRVENDNEEVILVT